MPQFSPEPPTCPRVLPLTARAQRARDPHTGCTYTPHDVFVALGELWGTQIFARIFSSESTHEEAVAILLPTYGVDDQRSAAPGVFTDPALQVLYDDLIAQGSRSLADAVQVGITIEKTDIADLSAAIPNAPEDVASVLERLLAASQKHLAAFERQA